MNETIENYHTNIPGSDYLYGILKKCLAEYYYVRNNLRRHGDEYSLGNLEDFILIELTQYLQKLVMNY